MAVTNVSSATPVANLPSPGGVQVGGGKNNLVGFYGATPIVQRTNASQTVIANAAAGTFGFNSAAEKTAWHTLLTELRLALVTVGVIGGNV